MTIFDVEIGARTGGPAALDRYRGDAVLVVNVATRFPPQTDPQDGGLTAAVEKLSPR